MVDARLYLPLDWCNDPIRCKESGIPNENRVFKTKLELALDIIRQQVENGVSFDYIGGDGYYGNDANLARAIEQMGYLYMLDIHSDQKIFTNQPELFIPERKGTKGPSQKKLKATTPEMAVSKYMESLQPSDWEKIEVRNTTKGKLTGEYHFAQVYIWDKNLDLVEPRMLVIRKTMSDKNTVEIKILIHQCQSRTIHTSGTGVYAGVAVLCRTLHQRIKTNTGIRSISDPKMAGMATSGSVEFIGVFVYSERKTVLF